MPRPSAILRRRDHEVRVRDPRHWREHNRKLGFEEVEKSAVRPHVLPVQVIGAIGAGIVAAGLNAD
jgi:hypothetical protein